MTAFASCCSPSLFHIWPDVRIIAGIEASTMNPAMMNPAMMNPAVMRGMPLGRPVAFAPVGQNGPASPGSPMGSPSYMPMPMGGGGW